MSGKSHVTRVSGSVRSKLLLASCAALAGISATTALAQSQTFTVTSLNDSGTGTLRDAITQANAVGAIGKTGIIQFNVAGGGTIPLSSMLPVLENPQGIQIDGSNGGHGQITLNGGATSNTNGDRIFFVGVAANTPAAGGGFLASTANTNFSISNFVLTNGNVRGGAGGGAAGGGAGMGGGLFLNAGTLTLSNVQFNGNRAVGGAGGDLGGGGGGGGMGGSGGITSNGGGGGGGIGVNASVAFGFGSPGGPGAFTNGASGGNGANAGGAGGTFGGGGGSAPLFEGGGGGGGVGGVSPTSGSGGNGGFGGGGGGGGVINGGGVPINGGAGGFGGGGGGQEGSSNSAGIGGFGGGGGSAAAGGFGGGSGGPYSNQTGGRGGGGAAMGGDIFIRQGASLNMIDGGISSGTLGGGTAANGSGGQGLGNGIFLAGSLTYTVSSGNTATVNPDIGGGTDAQITGGFTKAGPGLLVLNEGTFTSLYTGGLFIDSGTLAINSDGNLGGLSNVLTFGGGALRTDNNPAINHAINITSGNIGTIDTDGNTATISSQIAGGGALWKTGAGVLELNSANTFSGGVVVDAGILAITSDAALGPGTNIMSFVGGTLRTDASMTLNRAIMVFNTFGTVDTNGNAVSAPGQISGSAGFVKTGSGTLTLSYNNNTQLYTRINDGVLSIPFDQALGVGAGTLFMGGGTLQITNSFSNNRPMNLQGGTTSTIDTNGNTLIWSGNVVESGAGGSLTKTGAGLLYFANINSYTGTTTVNAGSLVLSGGAWPPVFNSGGADIQGGRLVFDYSGSTSPGGTVGLILKAGYGQTPKFSSGKLRTSNPADPNKGLGWIDNASLKGVFVAYTYYGDDNLDGVVNTSDFTTLAQNFNGTGKPWSLGDFNYDGKVNALDFNAIATNFGQPSLATISLPGTMVPEPASAVLIAMGLAPVLLRPPPRGGVISHTWWTKPVDSSLCIQLRDLVDGDLSIFFEQQLDAGANHMAAFTCKNPADRDAFDKHWARIIGDPTILKKTILCDERVAGHVMSFEQAPEREVCYWIGKEFWGRGIATRALTEFLTHVTIRPLFARVASDNVGSIRVLEKCGFEMCGKGKWFSNARTAEIDELILKLSLVSVVPF